MPRLPEFPLSAPLRYAPICALIASLSVQLTACGSDVDPGNQSDSASEDSEDADDSKEDETDDDESATSEDDDDSSPSDDDDSDSDDDDDDPSNDDDSDDDNGDDDPSEDDDDSDNDDESDDEDSDSDDDTSEGDDDSEDDDDDDLPEASGAFVTANIDDDNGNGKADFDEDFFGDDNDIAEWVLPEFPDGSVVKLSFSGDTDNLKIWKDGKDWMGAGGGAVKNGFEFESDGSAITVQVEMGEYNAKASVTLEDTTRNTRMSLPLQASPLIMNHHLQPHEHVWMVEDSGNGAAISGYKSALGSDFSPVSGSRYGGDVWIQDEIEFATMSGMNGARIDIVIDSIRDRGLDGFAEDEFTGSGGRAKDWVRGIWGSGSVTSGDSFGNLEASPPVTVDGVEYPFGRIYFGDRGNGELNADLAAFFEDQEIQKPFAFDTSWLCVSHVDEFLTFIPDKSAPKGFRMLYADVDEGYKLLESLDGNTSLSRYQSAHGVSSISQLVNDSALRNLNNDIQSDYLDPILDIFKEELGLDDEDIIRFPALFENASGCRGAGLTISLIPGTVNLIVTGDKPGENTKVFMPDPFLRGNGAAQSSDGLIQKTKELLPSEHELHFLDDWQTYHVAHGEVHCGTNVTRTPVTDWWSYAHRLQEVQ